MGKKIKQYNVIETIEYTVSATSIKEAQKIINTIDYKYITSPYVTNLVVSTDWIEEK